MNVNDECLVLYIFRLRTMTESTWKIQKLDWKTPGFFFPKEWEPCVCNLVRRSILLYSIKTYTHMHALLS